LTEDTPMKRRNRGRQAYTLVELLVTLGIVATLAGLLLPAVAMAREASARASCANNLRQIGIAFQHFHDTYQSMPPGIGYSPGYQAYGTALYHVLPVLEQKNLYERSFVDGFGWAGYNDVAAQPVKTFVCPSDPTAGGGTVKDNSGLTWGACSYGGNALVFCVVGSPPDYQFLNTAGYARLPATFKDGTSSTILFVEKYARCRNGAFPEGGSLWAYDYTGQAVVPLHPAIGIDWETYSVGPGSLFRPQPTPDDCDPTLASTPHLAGMNVLMADGSVHVLSTGVSGETWWALVTPNQGDDPGAW
jgi:prepilin-type N-terminal cleavage/methylation domain-containing protein/prepilin-type processing-associated H-X9-DG protein